MRCWLSDGRGFDERIEGPRWSDPEGFDALDVWSTIRLADVDGDGRADLCARSPRGFVCHRSTGRGFGPALPGPALASAEGWDAKDRYATLRLGDVDGDGLDDILVSAAMHEPSWFNSFERGKGKVYLVLGETLARTRSLQLSLANALFFKRLEVVFNRLAARRRLARRYP